MNLEPKPTGPSDETDLLRHSIRHKRDEELLTLIQGGDYGRHSAGDVYPEVAENGEVSALFRAITGGSDRQFSHLQRLADEARYPEIYPWKRGAKSKREQGAVVCEQSLIPTHISKEQLIDLYSAVSFANGFGAAMNVHVIIHWGNLGYLSHIEAAKSLQDDFFDSLREWYNYNNWECHDKHGIEHPHELYWIYSHECSRTSAFHTHILLAIPEELREKFRAWVKQRVKTLSKRTPEEKKNDAKDKTKGVVKIVCPPSHPIKRQWIFFQYICKGLDPKASVTIPAYEKTVPMADLLQFYYQNPGVINCKNRIGYSRNLSRKQRAKHGFLSFMERGNFDRRILYSSLVYDSWHRDNPKRKAEPNFDLSGLFGLLLRPHEE